MDLSVVIVNYNVRDLLATCLLSLRPALEGLEAEVFVVDNASPDGSAVMVRERFPDVTLIANDDNLGFARANNLALARARGRHLMLLNPDTVLRADSLTTLVRFLDHHPDYGTVGPKLLNADGSFQAAAKRAIPTPWSSFCKLSGLASLFPKSPLFNEYELGHLDPDERHEVGSLCGAAMVVRREAYDKVGGLDETYFMFGEDIAWCDAIHQAGWKVGYVPDSHILHWKGRSMVQDLARRDKHFFGAMKIFYRQRQRLGPLRLLLLDVGVVLARLAALLRRHRTAVRGPLLDLLLLAAVLWVLLPILNGGAGITVDRAMTGWLVASPVALLALLGIYREPRRGKPGTRGALFPILSGAVFAFLAAAGYFLSGVTQPFGLFLILWAGFGWIALNARRVLRSVAKLHRIAARSVVVGLDDLSRRWLVRHAGDRPAKTEWGWALWKRSPAVNPGDTLGLEISGTVEDLPALARAKRLTRVIFSAGSAGYGEILATLNRQPLRGAEDVRILDESWLWDDPAPGHEQPRSDR